MSGYGPKLTRRERKFNRQSRRYDIRQAVWRFARIAIPVVVAVAVLVAVCWYEATR